MLWTGTLRTVFTSCFLTLTFLPLSCLPFSSSPPSYSSLHSDHALESIPSLSPLVSSPLKYSSSTSTSYPFQAWHSLFASIACSYRFSSPNSTCWNTRFGAWSFKLFSWLILISTALVLLSCCKFIARSLANRCRGTFFGMWILCLWSVMKWSLKWMAWLRTKLKAGTWTGFVWVSAFLAGFLSQFARWISQFQFSTAIWSFPSISLYNCSYSKIFSICPCSSHS